MTTRMFRNCHFICSFVCRHCLMLGTVIVLVEGLKSSSVIIGGLKKAVSHFLNEVLVRNIVVITLNGLVIY